MEIIIFIAVIVLIVGFFYWGIKGGEKLKAERDDKLQRAEKANARIIGSHPIGLSGTGNGGHYQAYEFTLEVSNQFKAAYRTESAWEIYQMGTPKVQDGMEINVKIDADDPNVIYPVAEGVSFCWNWLKMHRK